MFDWAMASSAQTGDQFPPRKGVAWSKVETLPPFEGIQATSAAITGAVRAVKDGQGDGQFQRRCLVIHEELPSGELT